MLSAKNSKANDMNDIEELRERVNHLDPSILLGHVVWFTIPESAATDRSTLERECKAAGLNVALPPAPRATDVFKRACTSVQENRIPTSDPRRFVNLMSRRVGQDPDHVWRRLVEETVDFDGHTLSYEEVWEFRFNRADNTITSTPLIANPSTEAQQAADAITQYFRSQYTTITAYTIREWIRTVLRSLSSTALRDGVYFLRTGHAVPKVALDRVVNALSGASFHSLPLIDDRRQREMLKQAFEDESINEVDRLVGEITMILRNQDKKITSDRFATLKVECDRLRGRVAEYSDLLDLALDTTASRLEILQTSLQHLLGRVKI